jgi:ubiquinone/menaquinone biosynthesis C-methylase UbiE
MSSVDESVHADAVAASFGRQATTFEDDRLNAAFTDSTGWLVEHAVPAPDDLVLDVAAGTGLVARALAPLTRAVVALDATDAMLAAGKAAVDRDGTGNVVFQRGDATALPFLDATFSLAVTRFSLHHVTDPAALVRELARVCRPGGRVVVMDMVAGDDPEVAAGQDAVERRRDPAHRHLVTGPGLRAALAGAGLTVATVDERAVARPVEPWLAQGCTDEAAAAALRTDLAAEADGRGGPTGVDAHWHGDELRFRQHWVVMVGIRA